MSRRETDGRGQRNRSSRPISPPDGRSGPVGAFRRFLHELYLAADTPTLAALEEAVKQDERDDLPGAPARASIGRILDGKAPLPTNQADLESVVAVLARMASGMDEKGAREQAAELWRKARYAPPPMQLGQPISGVVTACDAAITRFSVHPAIEVDDDGQTGASVSQLPEYVDREHDVRIRAEIQRAVATGRPRAVVLVGGSSTGKTRACWEALRYLVADNAADGAEGLAGPSEWWVWSPLTPAELATGLAEAECGERTFLASRTVILLNELQDYLLPADGRDGDAAALRLLRLLDEAAVGSVVILGTIWRDPYWSRLESDHSGVGADSLSLARRLLRRVVAIDMPERIGDDRAAAEAAAQRDPRWRMALREAPDEPVQFLAGAAHLLKRYETASPTRQAVLHAVVDARRIGAPRQLSSAFIIDAARDYLSARDLDHLPPGRRDSEIWVSLALNGNDDEDTAALTRGSRGVRAPLHEVVGSRQTALNFSYELSDYVEQQLRIRRMTEAIPTSLWEACLTHLDGRYLVTVGEHAENRGLFRLAMRLFAAAAEQNPHYALWRGGFLLWRIGKLQESLNWFESAADAGDNQASVEIADILWSLGRTEEALDWY